MCEFCLVEYCVFMCVVFVRMCFVFFCECVCVAFVCFYLFVWVCMSGVIVYVVCVSAWRVWCLLVCFV